MSDQATSIRISSYNILSNHLVDWFTSCSKDALSTSKRWSRISAQLEDEFRHSSVICLQEVSQKWAESLHVLCANNNYHVVNAFYGSRKNGHMGVATLFDVTKYELLDVSIRTLGETRDFAVNNNGDASSSKNNGLVSFLPSIFSRFFHALPFSVPLIGGGSSSSSSTSLVSAYDPFEAANARYNMIIGVKLRCKKTGAKFCVVNYHMPCEFDRPKLMIIHTSLAATFALKFANGTPLALVGDWNSKPNSSCYTLMTTGSIASNHPDHPGSNSGWSPEFKTPFLSAYKEFLGKEPEWTNFAKVREDPIFIDTLDYIFISNHWKVTDVRKLKTSREDGPQPTIDEPSDHLRVSAQLELQPKAPKQPKQSSKQSDKKQRATTKRDDDDDDDVDTDAVVADDDNNKSAAAVGDEKK